MFKAQQIVRLWDEWGLCLTIVLFTKFIPSHAMYESGALNRFQQIFLEARIYFSHFVES